MVISIVGVVRVCIVVRAVTSLTTFAITSTLHGLLAQSQSKLHPIDVGWTPIRSLDLSCAANWFRLRLCRLNHGLCLDRSFRLLDNRSLGLWSFLGSLACDFCLSRLIIVLRNDSHTINIIRFLFGIFNARLGHGIVYH